MLTSNRLEGLRNIAQYYADLVNAGRMEHVEMLISSWGRLKEHIKKEEEKEKEKAMGTIRQIIQARIKHNETRLLWKKDIDFTNMSDAARSFSAGQASTWVSEIYFLKGVLEKIDKEVLGKECEGGGCEGCLGGGDCHH